MSEMGQKQKSEGYSIAWLAASSAEGLIRNAKREMQR